MRFAFIAKHRHIWPVNWLCEVLDVSRSGFHAWLNRPTSAREIQDANLVTAIETNFKVSDRTYGARRVWRDVLDLEREANGPGAVCSEQGAGLWPHLIERLIAEQCLAGAAQTPWKAERRRRTIGDRRQHSGSQLPS